MTHALRVVVQRELDGCGVQAHFIGLRTFQLNILFKHICSKDVAFQQEGVVALKCIQVPGTSTNLKSTIFAPCFFANCSTSSEVILFVLLLLEFRLNSCEARWKAMRTIFYGKRVSPVYKALDAKLVKTSTF